MRPDAEQSNARIEELRKKLRQLSVASPEAFPKVLFGMERDCHSERAIYVAQAGEDHILLSGNGVLLRCELDMQPWLLIPSYIPRNQGQADIDDDYAKYGQNAYSILKVRVNLGK